MKQILIFGSTGGTGKLVLEQALQVGYKVTIVVRDPGSFSFVHKHLEVIKGDVFQPLSFEKALKNVDIVVSCLGIQTREPTKVYSQGITNIINAMQNHNVKRIICLSAGAVIVPPKGNVMTKFFIKNLLQRFFKYLYADMLLMEKIVKATSLNYTIVRPPWLRNTKHTGKYRIAINDHLDNPTKIARADLADFIINHLADQQTYQSTIELSY